MHLSRLHFLDAGHEDGIWCSYWDTNGTLLTGSVDEAVSLWKEEDKALSKVHTFTGHTLGVISIVVHSDHQYAASSSLDCLVRCWNTQTKKTLHVLELPPTECWEVDFCPVNDKVLLAVAKGAGGAVGVWDLDSEETEAERQKSKAVKTMAVPQSEEARKGASKSNFVMGVRYSPDGRRIACSAMDGTVIVFDSETGNIISNLKGHNKPVRSICFTPDSKHLVTACDDMHMHMYNVEDASLIEAFPGHDSWVLGVDCHPDGTHIVSAGADAKVKLWEVGTRTLVQTLADHQDQVWVAKFSRDGTRLMTGADDGSMSLFAVG